MNTEDRIRKQRELVEEIGRYFDKEGFSPISGRILGLLMVMDKEQYTFDEIIEELQISKSSASNALRNLEIRGDIEYVTHPGDRKRYFQIKRADSSAVLKDMEDKMSQMTKLFSYIIELKADKKSPNSAFMNEMQEMIDLLLKKLEEVKRDFKK